MAEGAIAGWIGGRSTAAAAAGADSERGKGRGSGRGELAGRAGRR